MRDVGQLDLSYGSLSDAFSLDSPVFIFSGRSSQKQNMRVGKEVRSPIKGILLEERLNFPLVRIGGVGIGRKLDAFDRFEGDEKNS